MQEIKFSKELFNTSVFKWYKTQKRFCVIYGGSGSGKSHGIAQLLILKVLANEQMNIICFRKHSTDARNSVFALFRQIINDFGINDLFKINLTERKITHIESGNVILITGLDDSEKIKSITSETGIFSIAWIEEATEITLANLKQVSLRLRGQSIHNKTIYLSFNPISEEHWIKKDFIDLQNDKIDVYHSTYKDNKFIDKAYKEELESYKHLDSNYYNIYAKGEWGASLQGLVYPKIWKIAEIEKRHFQDTIYGLDFGFSTSKTALVEVNIIDYHNVYIRLLWYKTGTHIDSEFAGWLKSFVGKSPIYCDSAGSDKIDFLYNMGLNAKKSDKNVISGCELIQNTNIYIAKDSIEIIKEKGMYKWATDKNGNALGHPQKNLDDHALDAIRYALFTHFTTAVRYIRQAKNLTQNAEIEIFKEEQKIVSENEKVKIYEIALHQNNSKGKIDIKAISQETGVPVEKIIMVLKELETV